MPEMENPDPVSVTEFIENGRLPVFLSVTDCEVELLIARVPKLMLAGDAAREAVGFSPDPESGTESGAERSELEMTSEPFAVVAEDGA
jgi:hypothetical protein